MRIFYCPIHGRITEAQYRIADEYDHLNARCPHCRSWYYRTVKYKAKRTEES